MYNQDISKNYDQMKFAIIDKVNTTESRELLDNLVLMRDYNDPMVDFSYHNSSVL